MLHFTKGRKIVINNSNEINNYVHINDFLLIFKKIIKKNFKQKKFNLSTEAYTNLELFKLFKAYFNRGIKVIDAKNTYNRKENKFNVYKPTFTIQKLLEI